MALDSSELDGFRLFLVREYLREFPAAEVEDTLDRVITKSYALEQWRYDHEVSRSTRPNMAGKAPSAALGAPPPVAGGSAEPLSPGPSGLGLQDKQVLPGTALHPPGMDPPSSTPAVSGSVGGGMLSFSGLTSHPPGIDPRYSKPALCGGAGVRC